MVWETLNCVKIFTINKTTCIMYKQKVINNNLEIGSYYNSSISREYNQATGFEDAFMSSHSSFHWLVLNIHNVFDRLLYCASSGFNSIGHLCRSTLQLTCAVLMQLLRVEVFLSSCMIVDSLVESIWFTCQCMSNFVQLALQWFYNLQGVVWQRLLTSQVSFPDSLVCGGVRDL